MGMDAKLVTRGEGRSYWMGGLGEEKLGSFTFLQEILSSPSGGAFLYVVIVVTLALKTWHSGIDSVVLLLWI